ncbi:hypothetical protein SAMN05660976_07124 [Nonomuraea pusilla]|uniref:Uncharacterized protein n=1 Tax=Nonomuraea pusilla TaxID=46177 RepID=A0A1H8EVK0_9ACTN|nr:hypothetical protein SAMN05660976_07124 [Nonomuraea pusilla]
MRSLRVVLAVLVVVVLGGGDGMARWTSEPGRSVTASCPRTSAAGRAESPRRPLPEGFVAAYVVRCRPVTRYLPGRGLWEAVIQERADGPAGDLVAALRRPSERPLFPAACTLMGFSLDYFVVVDSSGRAVLPLVPTGWCGGPYQPVPEAVRRLTFRVEGVQPVQLVESEEDFRAGCARRRVDVLRLARSSDLVPWGRRPVPVWDPPPDGLRVCVYRATRETRGRSAGSRLPTGRLQSSYVLTGDRLRALLAALDGTRPGRCPRGHARFAVLDPGGAEAYVGLGECPVVLRLDEAIARRLPPAGVLGLLS